MSTKVRAQDISRLHAAGQYSRLLAYGNKIDSLRGEEALLVADAYFRHKNPGKAEDILYKVIKRGYTTEEAYWQMAQVLLAQEKWVEALEYTEKALKYDLRNYTYLKTRAGILLQLGKNREAEAEYRMLIKLRPGDESLYWLAYQAMAEQEDYRRGKAFLLQHLSKFKTPGFQNNAYDALIRTYLYTLKMPDSAYYFIKKWQNATGISNENLSAEILVLTRKGNFTQAMGLIDAHKSQIKMTNLGVLFDEIDGGSDFALQVYYHPGKKEYTAFVMDSEKQYFQGKIHWKTTPDRGSKVRIELPRQLEERTYAINPANYHEVRAKFLHIARAINNLE
ncbi:tetratricopeptide repeat protein [Schleiferia thermophila]